MKLFYLLIVVFSLPALAERMTTKIHSIEVSKKNNEPHLILFENGKVGFVSAFDKSILPTLREEEKRGDWLEVELDSKGNFLGGSVVAPPKLLENDPVEPETTYEYEPTNYENYSDVSAAFFRMKKRHQRDSQCYNRAHIWAYEEFKRTNLQSMKLFMFFTSKYIREYRYGWWFHVTPMTYLNNIPLTMDRTFTNGPLAVRQWTNKFIYSGRACPIVTKYSEYRYNQEKQHCYLIPATMYYWQPRDLERLENTGEEKTQFIKSEVDWAYWEAF